MPIIRVLSPLTGTELLRRLHALGIGQKTFARRNGISWRHFHRYIVGELQCPAFIHRLLLCEEAMFALARLAQTDAERCGKLQMRAILKAASEPITATSPPTKSRRKAAKRKPRNSLGSLPKILPQPTDLMQDHPLWQELAGRIGQDAADRLHRKLSERRPRRPRRSHLPTEDRPPISRTTDPI